MSWAIPSLFQSETATDVEILDPENCNDYDTNNISAANTLSGDIKDSSIISSMDAKKCATQSTEAVSCRTTTGKSFKAKELST